MAATDTRTCARAWELQVPYPTFLGQRGWGQGNADFPFLAAQDWPCRRFGLPLLRAISYDAAMAKKLEIAERRKRAAELDRAGRSRTEIATALGISERGVYRLLAEEQPTLRNPVEGHSAMMVEGLRDAERRAVEDLDACKNQNQRSRLLNLVFRIRSKIVDVLDRDRTIAATADATLGAKLARMSTAELIERKNELEERLATLGDRLPPRAPRKSG